MFVAACSADEEDVKILVFGAGVIDIAYAWQLCVRNGVRMVSARCKCFIYVALEFACKTL
jgi:hypothetical protein